MAVVKIVELIGSSPKDWEDAAKNALAEAAKTIKNIKSLYARAIFGFQLIKLTMCPNDFFI